MHVEPTVILQENIYSIEASASTPHVYNINMGFPNEKNYLLIENKQPIGFDKNLPHGGLAHYHVDESISYQGGTGYPAVDSWPENGCTIR